MTRSIFFSVVALLAASVQAGESAANCNAELGKQIFALCSACHALDVSEPAREGPPLRGAYSRAAASGPNFKYSPAMRASKWIWDAATLDKFLLNPRRALPGTTMTFIGLKSAQERAAVACYLRST